MDPRTASRRWVVLDVMLAAGLIFFFLGVAPRVADMAAGDMRTLDATAYGLMVVAAAVTAFRRRWPEPVVAVATLAVIAYVVRDYPGGPIFLAPLLALYSLATARPRRVALVVAVLAAGSIVAVGSAFYTGSELAIHVLYMSWAVAVVFVADAARNRRAYLASLEERARQAEETRDEEARRRVAEERLRIARDVHDLVAHSLAAINVQSGVAAHVMGKRPDEARDALLAIKAASGETLTELRAALGLLRKDSDAAADGLSGLSRLDALVDSAARAGLEVGVHVNGAAWSLPPAVDLAAYRIVQESLTNVIRHAAAATAKVSVRYRVDRVEVEVADDGNGAAPGADNGAAGHGITGMRERARALGGCFEAGRLPAGGFRVWASLPVDQDPQ